MCVYACVWERASLSHVQLFVTVCTVGHQAPLSMGFSWQEYWSELPFPSPGDLSNPGFEPRSPTLQADSLPFAPPGKLTFSITIPVFKEFISFFYFRLCWVFVAAHGLSLVAERRLLSSDHAQPSHHSGFSCCSSQALRLSGCGTGAWLLHGMWNLPGPGIKPMFPALAAVLNYWTTREVSKFLKYLKT